MIFFVALAVFLPVIMSGYTFKPMCEGVLPSGAYGYDGAVFSSSGTMDPWGSCYEDSLRIFGKRSIFSGEFPFWNPYQGIGQPYFANKVSGLLSAFSPLYLSIPYLWWDIVDILNLILIIYFAYLFFSITGFSPRFALFVSLAMMSCTYFYGYLAVNTLTSPVPWVFLLLYAIERSFQEPAWKWKIPLIVFGTYALCAAGHPSPTLIGALFIAGYVLLKMIFCKHVWKTTMGIILLMLIGILLAAPEWLTFLDYVAQAPQHNVVRSYHYNMPNFRNFFVPYAFHPGMLLMCSLPSMISFFSVAGIVYIFKRRPKTTQTILIFLWFVLQCKLLGFFPFTLLEQLPLINRINFAYAGFLTAFGWALLAGFGFAFLCNNPAKFFRRVIPAWIIFISVVISLYPYFYFRIGEGDVLYNLLFRRTLFERLPLFTGLFWFAFIPFSFYIIHRKFPGSLKRFELLAFSGFVIQIVSYYPNAIKGGVEFATCMGAIFYILLFIMLVLFRGRMLRKLFFVSLLSSAVMQLIIFNFYPGQPKRYDFLTPAPYVNKLRQLSHNGKRCFGETNFLWGNISGLLGFSSINVIASLQSQQNWKFFQLFVDRKLSSTFLFFIGSHNYTPDFPNLRKVFELLAVKYYISVGDYFLNHGPSIRKIYEDPKTNVRIFENTSAGERVFFLPGVRFVRDQDEAIGMISRLAETKDTAYIEEKYKSFLPENAEGNRAGGNNRGKLRSFRLTSNHVYIEYDVPYPGVIVLADSYMAGWRANVDGKETPVFAVNGIFRGLFVNKKGPVSIEFWYKPRLWNVAFMLVGIGVFSLLGILLLQLRYKE